MPRQIDDTQVLAPIELTLTVEGIALSFSVGLEFGFMVFYPLAHFGRARACELAE